MSHTHESCLTHMSHVAHTWFMSHTRHLMLSYVSGVLRSRARNSSLCSRMRTRMNESWVMSHTHESCCTRDVSFWVMSVACCALKRAILVSLSMRTRMNESWVMSHKKPLRMSHVSGVWRWNSHNYVLSLFLHTHINEWCRTEWAMCVCVCVCVWL